MKTINFRFLHYKKYDKFKQDLVASDKIKEGDIVFIQDALRIWARGKEYTCDGPYTSEIENDSIAFKNGKDNSFATLSLNNGTITFKDNNNNTVSETYVLKDSFDYIIRELQTLINNKTVSASDVSGLAKVAKTGQYSDLIDTPDPITIDTKLSSTSTNPVLNKAVYSALENKADKSELTSYVSNLSYQEDMRNKQDKLTAESPVYIRNNRIGVEIDNEFYVIVSDVTTVEPPNPNKIYLQETPDGQGGVIYLLFRYKNGQWVSIGQLLSNIDLSEYLKSSDAELLYQPKIDDYVKTIDLLNYTPLSRTEALEESLNDYVQYNYLEKNYLPKGEYAYSRWVENTFVKKEDVYTPNEGGESSEYPGGTIVGPSGLYTNGIIVDDHLDIKSNHPVQNSVVTAALNEKQDKLTAGDGIEISNNVISVTVDNDLFVITNDVNSISTPNPNKIYLLTSVENGLTVYTEYRYINGEWVSFGVKDIDIDLSGYAKLTDLQGFITSSYLNSYTLDSDFEEYKLYVDRTYAKSQIVINPSSNVDIDEQLDETSPNPVENRAIKAALDLKADKSELRNYALKSELNNKADASLLTGYVTTQQHLEDLAGKQDVLIPAPGGGISIVDNLISCTVDTDFIIITNNLQSIGSPNPNKIYLLETTDNGETVYIEYRWKDNDWVEIGTRTPEVNLTNYYTKLEADSLHNSITTNYLSKQEASLIYQTKIDDYATSEDIEELDDKFDDYATKQALEALKTYSDIKFASKGNYVLAEDVATALLVLQTIIDQKYVLKRDVYRPNDADGWSTAEATEIAIQGASGGSSTGGTTVINNMVTLSASSYQRLVDANMVDETTYYFTYEDEEETTTNWTFGNTFPVILAGDGLGEFPIALT